MGLFDDLPNRRTGLFDDLPEATPSMPVASDGGIGLGPVPAAPVLPVDLPIDLSVLFADPAVPVMPDVAVAAPQPAPQPVNVQSGMTPANGYVPAPTPPVSLVDVMMDLTDDARAGRGFGRTAYLDGLVDAPQLPQAAMPVPSVAPEAPVQSWGDVGSRFMRGVTEVPASVPESLAIAGAGNPNAAPRLAAEIIQRAEDQILMADQRLQDMPEMGQEQRQRIEAVKAEAQQQIDAYRPLLETADGPLTPDAQDRPLYKRGDQVRQASQELFGTPDPQFDDKFIGKLSEGAGSLAGFVATTLLTGVVGGAATGSAVNASQMYRRARQGGATEEQAKTAAFIGSMVGASEVFPIGRALDMLPSSMRGKVAQAFGQRLSNAFATGGEEAVQEALVEISNNLTEKGIWNSEKAVFEGADENALIGGILGTGLGLVAPTRKVVTTEPPQPKPKEGPNTPPNIGGADEPPQQPVAPAPVGPSDPAGGARPSEDTRYGGGNEPVLGRPDGQDAPQSPPVANGTGQPEANLNAETTEQAEPQVAPEAPAPNPERRSTVYTPDNEPVEVEYQVVEADSVLTSDQEGYDQTAQPRNREDNINSEIQIEGIANNPNFARLNRAPETDRGAPLVGSDGLVESGNGRTIGLRRAYERGTAGAYRAALEAEYPEAVGMRNPMVIARRITEDMDRQDLAYRSNVSETQQMSASEAARAEARMLDKDVLDLYRSGPITNAANRGMVMAFIKRLPKSQQNALITKDGGLSAEGVRRVEQAMFHKAYDDAALLNRMAESVDNDMRGITTVLTDLAPKIARMRDEMQRGDVAAEGDFVPALVEALGQVSNMRSRDQNLADFKAQIDAFADPISDDVSIIMDALFNPAGTRLASKKAVADFLEFAIEGASAQDTTVETMPGIEPVPPKPAGEILQNAKRRTETDQEQTSLLDRAPQPGKRAPEVRKEEQRTADGRGGETDGRTGESAKRESAKKVEVAKKRLNDAELAFDALDAQRKISDAQAYFDASIERSDAREAYADTLAAQGGRIELRAKNGLGAVITPRQDGKPGARITYFDSKGFSGDTQHDTLKAAVRDAFSQGYIEEASGYLKKQKTKWDSATDSGTSQVKDTAALKAKPGGKLSPTFMEFAYTNRLSVYNHAFTAAGMDPAKARQLPVEDQIDIAKKAVMETFGIEIILPKIKFQKKNIAGRKVTDEKISLASRKALDQILNAYRQLQMLSHIMGIPEKAVGLPIEGKAIQLSLVKGNLLRGALGMFSWGGGKRVISIADMSNSFAHEWGHALDHYLSVMADRKTLKGMLSREMAETGVVPPFSPKRALTDAFAHIMWSMMGKASGAGEVVIRLQVESAQLGPDGKPTPKAMRARQILTDIRKGKTPPKEYWSDYFKTSRAFDEMTQSGGYFTDPAEMFARAFEAYIAHTVGQISDQPQAFLSKGDFGGTTDARLNLTFPKEVDMAQFVLAMGNLQHAMARIKLHGPNAPANAPNTHDIMDVSAVLRSPEGTMLENLTARERAEWSRSLEAMKNAPASLKDMSKSAMERAGVFYSQFLRTTAATMYAVADRQPTPEAREAFTNIAKAVGKRPGSGQYQGDVWEQKVRSRVAQHVNRLDIAIQKAGKGLIKGFKALKPQDMRDVNALLRGDKLTVRPEIDQLVETMRNILDKIWYELDSAGIEMGYESRYLPHRYDPRRATKEPDKFRAQAAKVYQLMFDREIVDNTDDASQIADMNAIIRGLMGNKKAVASGDVIDDPRLTQDDVALVEKWRKERKRLKDLQRRQAKSEDPDKFEDKIGAQSELVENLHGELLDALRDKWSKLSAERWLTKIRTGNLQDFGSIGPTASFLKGRKLPREAASYMREFMEENPVEMLTGYILDAVRRSEYAKVFGAKNEKLEAMLMAAEGASREDVELMKTAVAASTGRVNKSMSGFASAYTAMFTGGTLALLDKASLSSLAEPITIGLRSGQVRDSFNAVGQFMVNMVRFKKHKELKDLARTIGLIMPYAQDTLMQNRMGLDVLNNAKTLQTVTSRFFIINMLTPLTHYQRAVMLPVANSILLRHLREDVTGKRSFNSKLRDKVDGSVGGFVNGELNELGIAKDERKDLLDWMESVGGMPSPEDLVGPDGEFSRAGELWSRATIRLSTESIQDTLKSDRAMAANDPNLAALYSIQSFTDAFTRNVIWRSIERGMKPGDSLKAKGAKATANIAMALPAAATLYLGQLLTGLLREALINTDELEEKIEKGEVMEWMLKRTWDRTGFSGRLGPFINAATGLRYQTDMTSLFAGPYAAYLTGNFQRVLAAAFGRNSPNNNTAEFNAAEGIYRNMVRIPATALIAGLMPAGPLSAIAPRAAIYFLGHRDTEDGFAEMLVGEKGTKHVGDPPWWELGD